MAEMTAAALRLHLHLNVVATISTFADASRRLTALSPNIVIFDNRLEDGLGIELLRSLRSPLPRSRWLMYSGFASTHTLNEAISAGLDGAVAKRAPLNVLVDAVKAVLAGRRFFCEFTTKEMNRNNDLVELSSTERRIVELVASGMEAKEIAAILGTAHKTVLNGLVSIRKKIHVNSLVQISDYARNVGLSSAGRL